MEKDINYWIARCAMLEQELDMLKESPVYDKVKHLPIASENELEKPIYKYFSTIQEEEKMKESEMLLGWVSESKGKRLITHKEYEIKKEGDEFYLVKKKPQYLESYEECCEVLGKTKAYQSVSGYKTELLEDLQKLLICRDAYWKIAGDWKFNFEEEVFYLCNEYGKVCKFQGVVDYNAFLAFPSKEMRDVFYKNFKELIEECKELL